MNKKQLQSYYKILDDSSVTSMKALSYYQEKNKPSKIDFYLHLLVQPKLQTTC